MTARLTLITTECLLTPTTTTCVVEPFRRAFSAACACDFVVSPRERCVLACYTRSDLMQHEPNPSRSCLVYSKTTNDAQSSPLNFSLAFRRHATVNQTLPTLSSLTPIYYSKLLSSSVLTLRSPYGTTFPCILTSCRDSRNCA